MASIKYNEKKKFYEVRYDAGFDGEGNRIQKYKGGFPKKKDAEDYLAKQKNDLNQGTYIDPTKIFLFEYLNDWLEGKRAELSPTTYTGYELNIRCHINPYIGGLRLQELKAVHIKKLYAELKKDREIKVSGIKRHFEPLSGTSIQYVHRVLSKALEDAYREETIGKNPAKLITPPAKEKFRAGFLSVDQIKEMLDRFKDDDMFIPVYLSVVLGLRRGEVLGLQWTDIDFENKIIHIRNNYIMVKGKAILREETKTASSARDIVVTDRIIEILKAHRLEQKKMRLLLGDVFHKSDFVCTKTDGRPFSPSHLTKGFARRMKKYGLPPIRLHDLRHSNASLMISQNIPMKGASDRLGHSTIQITNDLYGHIEKSVQEEIAKKIDQVIWGE